jgi:Icc-related predicted phosphoesterase
LELPVAATGEKSSAGLHGPVKRILPPEPAGRRLFAVPAPAVCEALNRSLDSARPVPRLRVARGAAAARRPADVPEWFYTSDLHGQSALYEQVIALVAARRPRAVLIGGDLCPHDASRDGVQSQRLFLDGFLVEFARRLREAVPGIALLLMMGNDDWAANHDCLERGDGALWHLLHDRTVAVDGTCVAGLSWVPITPFGMKDWERWDDGAEERPARLEGFVSRGGVIVPHRFDPEARTPTIADALADLGRSLAPAETLFVCHSPPRDTRCDLVYARQHVGSRALRAFLERHQPPLVLSGHIHESPRMSSAWRDAIGRTVVVNPGQFGTSRLCGVWFDPADLKATLRHTVFE